MLAGQEVQAKCDFTRNTDAMGWYRPTTRLDATAPVGAVMYNDTWRVPIVVICDGIGANVLHSMLFDSENKYYLFRITRDSYYNTNHRYESTLDFPGVGKSIVGAEIEHSFPPGKFTKTYIVSVNLQYRRGSDPLVGEFRPIGTQLGDFNRLGMDTAASSTAYSLKLIDNTRVANATCAVGSQTVRMSQARLQGFTGVGSASNTGRTDFDVPINCSNVDASMRIGLSFSLSDQHESGAAGVIKTDQGANNAAGIGLQIINRTSNLPIQFGQFEPGVAKTGDGTYSNPYRVQYYQTGETPTAGIVTGRTTVTVVYQ
jgi:type 1 fimbria pilin